MELIWWLMLQLLFILFKLLSFQMLEEQKDVEATFLY